MKFHAARYLQLLLLVASCRVAPAASPAPADVIYLHGNILTGAHLRELDPSPTPARVQALAIVAGSIVAVGTDAAILPLRGPHTIIIDLHHAFVMPGFNDAHTHMAAAGQQQLSINLDGTHSLAEMLDRIRTSAQSAGNASSWLVGGGWDHTLWRPVQLPTRADLDRVTGTHPAFFHRVDVHMAVANTAALAAADITSATPDPSGAKIDRDPQGQPTGILRETAATALLEKVIPPPTPDQRRRALLAALADALAQGVTSVQDNSNWQDFLVLQQLEHTGELKLRVAEWQDFNLPVATLEQQRRTQPADDPLLHLTQLKGFLDGSLGSRTAAMLAPYTDDPANSGLPRYTQPDLNRMVAERTAAGFQIGLHAIGDRANSMALTAFAAAQPPAPRTIPDLRLRIEHAQILDPADFARFASLGVVASMQPSHLLTDMRWAPARLGPRRFAGAYAWRTMLDHHVTLAFGTDYPVESIDPMRGLYSAVTRQNERGTQTFEPDQRLTLAEAIYAYTQAPAFAEFREHTKGRLEPGFLADLVVLDRDITTIPAADLLHTRILRTVVNGETVFKRPANGPIAPANSSTAAPDTE